MGFAGSIIFASIASVAMISPAYVQKKIGNCEVVSLDLAPAACGIGSGRTLFMVSFLLMACPIGTGMFAGAFYSFMGAFQIYPIVTALAVLSMVLVSTVVFYAAWKFAAAEKTEKREWKALGFFECASISVIIIFVIALGVFPGIMSQRLTGSAEAFSELSRRTKSIVVVPADFQKPLENTPVESFFGDKAGE
jgi:NADH:ubiquinone oxidoreductase subunit 4 (subunit M)